MTEILLKKNVKSHVIRHPSTFVDLLCPQICLNQLLTKSALIWKLFKISPYFFIFIPCQAIWPIVMRIVSRVYHDQPAFKQSDLGLHCLLNVHSKQIVLTSVDQKQKST